MVSWAKVFDTDTSSAVKAMYCNLATSFLFCLSFYAFSRFEFSRFLEEKSTEIFVFIGEWRQGLYIRPPWCSTCPSWLKSPPYLWSWGRSNTSCFFENRVASLIYRTNGTQIQHIRPFLMGIAILKPEGNVSVLQTCFPNSALFMLFYNQSTK